MTPKPNGMKLPAMVHMTPELFNEVDKRRGLIPRSTYLADIIERALKNDTTR